MNPNGLVPTIKDGDFVLWESNSIMRYLNAKYGNGKLLPASPEGMASANRWMDWQLSAFNPVIVPLFFATIRTPPDKRDPEAIKAALDKTVKAWQMVEDHLAKHRFLGGEEFSLGDIPLGVWAYRWFHLPIDRPKQPNLERWYNAIKQRKPYQTHIMIPVT
jgi:glutathione S-transferase